MSSDDAGNDPRIETTAPSDPAAFRDAVYRGRVFRMAATPASLAFATELLARVAQELETSLDGVRDVGPADLLVRLARLRDALRSDPSVIERARVMLGSLGVAVDEQAIDHPRVRAILHRGHETPAAAPAYVAHRDTWYANPRAQINWWLALHDVDPDQTFEIFPDLLEHPVDNDSARFDYDAWLALAGWQNPNRDPRAAYPAGVVPEEARSLGFSAKRGEVLVFAGGHLHRTRRNVSGRTRFSVDVRTVHLADHRAGRGANVVDARCTGDAMRDYLFPPASSSRVDRARASAGAGSG
jgi:hypothetical protein